MKGEFEVHADRVNLGKNFSVSFQRTLRVPEDGKVYPLPPGLGAFPLHRAADYAGKIPGDWDLERGVFISLYQREALWLSFAAPPWKPSAVKVGAGEIDALTGARFSEALHAAPQDYLVCPDQPWLDGFLTAAGVVRQFVAMPLGKGYAVSEQLGSLEHPGGLEIVLYTALPGHFPDKAPEGAFPLGVSMAEPSGLQQMGLAAGGRIEQKIYPDPYGIDTWDKNKLQRLKIYLVNSLQFLEITGEAPPDTPVDARLYTRLGLPWYKLYDQEFETLPASEKLAGVEPTGKIDRPEPGSDKSLEIEKEKTRPIPKPRRRIL